MFSGCCFGSGGASRKGGDVKGNKEEEEGHKSEVNVGHKDEVTTAKASNSINCPADDVEKGEEGVRKLSLRNSPVPNVDHGDYVEKKNDDSKEKALGNINGDAEKDMQPTKNTVGSRLKSDASNVTVEECIPVERRSKDNTSPKSGRSILIRGSSSKSLNKKHVNYNDSAELIPPAPNSSDPSSLIEDDEVFSDSVPPQLPRGDMCAPYFKKRGSMPGLVALPDWFGLEFYREEGGNLEPPVTPVGRDELAMKRHRFFSDILSAAHAATEHRVRFNPLGPSVATVQDLYNNLDCDPNLRPSLTSELESLINRLERIVDRFERSVSAIQLERVATLLPSRQSSQDHQIREFVRNPEPAVLEQLSQTLEQRIVNLERNLKENNLYLDETSSIVEEEIPTVVHQLRDFSNRVSATPPPTPLVLDGQSAPVNPITNGDATTTTFTMSVNGYEDILLNNLSEFLTLSAKIGGDVSTQADLVKKAFDAQFEYIKLASTAGQPNQDQQNRLLQPTSSQIGAIQEFREKHRTSPYFNHLSAISESIPALGWVCVAPTPGPHVKEMNDAGQFYTNRVLKDWKEKDKTHVEWARSWVQTLTELQKYIKQWHTTGLVWSGKGPAMAAGGAPPPPPPGGMPPPPPPIGNMADLSLQSGGDDRSALFAEINRGESVTKHLKKVSADMQTHKNPGLRSGPAPFKAPGGAPVSAGKPVVAQDKAPVFTRDGKKWLIEYQKSNPNLLVDQAEMNNVVYMFRCENSTLTVKGKINSIVMDSCKKCSVLFDAVISSVEFVNCQNVQMQVLGKVPTISIDKTDGCQMYLSKDSMNVEIISSKSSEGNVLIPTAGGDYTEQAIPEQFKTTITGNNTLVTVCVDSLG